MAFFANAMVAQVLVERIWHSLPSQCPLSEVRHTWQHPRARTSESKGHWQLYGSSAAFDL